MMLSNSVEAQNTGNLTTEGDCSPIVIESGDLTLNCPGIPPRFEELIGSVRRGMYMDWFVERFGEPRFAFCDHAIYSDKGIAIVIQADENDIRTGSVSAFALTTLEDFNIHGALDPDARYNSFGAKNFPNESFSDLYSWYVKEEKIPCVFGSLFMDSRLGRRTDLYMQCSQYGGGVENRDRNMPSEVKFLFHSDEKDYEDHFRGLGVSMVTKIADSRFDGRITFPFSTTIGNVDFHREFLRQQENGGARDFLEVFGSLAPNHVDVGSMICNNG
ncbi:hypothetical protein IWQ55_001353 [Labrenzia sp. EL_208]|nr:hypothetical protein [Labrenzia sp. EL_132]MBG6228155.1 hypothetical protein [Labrenzia sp. EL_208]